jgi:hypothetical protein
VVQTYLHNELVREAEVLRDKLETADATAIVPLQAGILARRELLGFLHRHDKPKNPTP